MKKLTTLSAIALLAFGIAACDKKADPAADYTAYKAWSTAQNDFQVKATAEFEQQLKAAVQAQNPQGVQAAFQTYADKVAETVKTLNALKVSSDDVKNTQAKLKAYLTAAQEMMQDSANMAIVTQPTAEQQQALAAKQQQVKQLMEEAKEAQAALSEKYGKK